jgi:hypothetical protein
LPYHFDFKAIPLDALRARLEKADIATLEDLCRGLHGAKGPTTLAEKTDIAENYLIMLRRAIEGFRPKPIHLEEYLGVDPAVIAILAAAGIRDSKILYEALPDKKARDAFAKIASPTSPGSNGSDPPSREPSTRPGTRASPR